MAVEFGISMAIRAAIYLGLFWYGVWKGRSAAVSGLEVPKEIFGPLTGYLAWPYLESGQMSVSMALTLSITALTHFLENLIGQAA